MFGELAEVRPVLLSLHRTAALRFDEIGQETILNLLLRNFLHYNLYDQAEKLRSKAQLPASRSNQQQCRYLYYLGRIRAIQLEYSEAKECLTQAHRKAPALAKGFTLELVKWITVVRLLLGEIPEKKDLTEGGAWQRAALKPYLDLTQAVRLGDLEKFRVVMEKHGAVFLARGDRDCDGDGDGDTSSTTPFTHITHRRRCRLLHSSVTRLSPPRVKPAFDGNGNKNVTNGYVTQGSGNGNGHGRPVISGG